MGGQLFCLLIEQKNIRFHILQILFPRKRAMAGDDLLCIHGLDDVQFFGPFLNISLGEERMVIPKKYVTGEENFLAGQIDQRISVGVGRTGMTASKIGRSSQDGCLAEWARKK